MIPNNLKTLNYKRLPEHMKNIIVQLAWRIQNLNDSIKADATKQKNDKKGKSKEDAVEPPPVIDYIHRKDIKKLV